MLTSTLALITGWLLGATIGTWAYFAGEARPSAPNLEEKL
jgi:hypothetical protein